VKYSKAQIIGAFKSIPRLEFEEGSPMTAFSGLVVFDALFKALDLRARLCRCLSHLDGEAIYRCGTMLLMVVVQILLGHRRLRDRDQIEDDPMVKRVVGLKRLPDVSAVSRMFSRVDQQGVANVRALARDLVLGRLVASGFRTVTADFDGSVQSTKGHAEGTAVGFNKKKKGARSYYPLLATIAQTGQVLDVLHRPGNVHDSNGAVDFMSETVGAIRQRLRHSRVEARFDSAFFNKEVLEMLDAEGVEFTGSVPFRRFPELKQVIETNTEWKRINDDWSSAMVDWRPKSWSDGFRFEMYRRRRAKQRKGPLQLDLFEPRDYEYEFKVVVTNKLQSASPTVLYFHNGRGSQEKLIGECKQHAALDVIPTKTLRGNQLFCLAGILAHNLGRELQMRALSPDRITLPKRPARWTFKSLGTLRKELLHRVGRFLRPQGYLTLRVAGDDSVQSCFERYLGPLQRAA